MPKILELKVEKDGHVWARLEFPAGQDSVTLWTEAEKNAALAVERERCMTAVFEQIAALKAMKCVMQRAGVFDDGSRFYKIDMDDVPKPSD